MIILAHVYLVTKHLSWFPQEYPNLFLLTDYCNKQKKGKNEGGL